MKGMDFPRWLLLLLFGGLVLALAPQTPLHAESSARSEVAHSAAVTAMTETAPKRSLNSHKLKVAVCDRPPFSFKDGVGAWNGLSVDLWEQIAGKLGITYEYVEMPLVEIMKQLRTGKCDLSPVIALSGEEAGNIEFTAPYLFSHGAVLTPHKSLLQSLTTFHGILMNKKVLIIFLAMLLGMIFFSLLLMFVERKHEKGHFSGPSVKGFGSALWFSAVTMTTVGYGDKTPLSLLGRVVTFFWMLAGVLIIAVFTGTVASSLTRAEMKEGIVSFNDLPRFKVGCVAGSRMDFLLQERGIPAKRFNTYDEIKNADEMGLITAFAGDVVPLQYMMNRNPDLKCDLYTLPDSAMIYAFATRQGLPQLSAINRELLKISLLPDWRSKAERWTGPLSL
jgi:ABC-type amino acid transport substrate-binding protein